MKKILSLILTLCTSLCFGLALTACDFDSTEPEHTHSFINEVVEDEYLETEATCEYPATYYYSCSCGEKGDVTFENGEPLGHDYTECVSNGDGTHTKKSCSRVSWHTEIETCSGGLATCSERAICKDCHEEYGEKHVAGGQFCAVCGTKLYSEGLSYELGFTGNYYIVSRGTCIETDIVIPAIHNSLPVKEVAVGELEWTDVGAFSDCDSIESIIIPDSVEYIGVLAFANCDNLKCVTMGNNVENIGYGAFADCDSLMSITIPESVTTIERDVFNSCDILTSVVMGSGVTSIGTDAFKDCKELAGVYISDILKWCEIEFNTLSADPFSNPLYYANNLYLNNQLVTELVIPDGVTSINDYAFENCTSLLSVSISDTVLEVGYSTFRGCSSLANITIGVGVDSIRDYAFYGCEALTSVHISDMAKWCAIDFNNYYENPLNYARNLYLNNQLVTELVIPDGVTSINAYTFRYCDTLTSVTIPDSVVSIESAAFRYCVALKKVCISDVSKWCAIDFGDKYANPLYCAGNLYLNNQLLTKLEIPVGVASVNSCAFYNCSSLTSVKLSNTVKEIGAYAFAYCGNMTSAESLDGVKIIGDSSFYNCSSLSSVTLGNEVEEIESYAFYNCSSLTSVKIPDSIKEIGAYAFAYCGNMTSAEIGNGVTDVGEYAFRACESLAIVTIGDSVTKISRELFHDCCNLTSVTIGVNVSCIEDCAFDFCPKLVEVINKSQLDITVGSTVFGEVGYYAKVVHNGASKVINVDDYLFYTYDGVNYLLGYIGSTTTLTLPDDYDGQNYAIYSYAFYNSDDIRSVQISDGVTGIGTYAFRDCGSLLNITIGSNVETIGDWAFDGCHNLVSLTLQGGHPTIGNSPFSSCKKLVEVINKSDLTITPGKTTLGYLGYYAKEVHTGSSKIVNVEDYLFYTYEGINYLLGYIGTETILMLPDSYNGQDYAIYRNAFYDCDSLTSVEIGDNVTSIGAYAFQDCNNLMNISISDSVAKIGDGAFDDCDNLQYNEKTGCLYLGNSSNPYLYLVDVTSTDVTSITIDEKCKFIGDYAFSYCASLKIVVIPNSVKGIGCSAFSFCSGLTSVTIPNGVVAIGASAFRDCTRLTSVVIPNSISTIGGYYVFSGCDNLTEVYYGGTVNEWEEIKEYYTDSNATLYYYSETEPATSGDYWRYVDGIPTVW